MEIIITVYNCGLYDNRGGTSTHSNMSRVKDVAIDRIMELIEENRHLTQQCSRPETPSHFHNTATEVHSSSGGIPAKCISDG